MSLSAAALLTLFAFTATLCNAFAPYPSSVGSMAARKTSSSQRDASRTASAELVNLFNDQVTKELEASQLYLAASIWCDGQDFGGMAGYMRKESEEERGHAMEMIDFANKRNLPVTLKQVSAPHQEWQTPEDLWQNILNSETENTESLLKLADAAAQCNDHAVTAFLMPFHMEQINAEDSLRTILAKVRDENKTPGLLRQLDSELGGEASAHT